LFVHSICGNTGASGSAEILGNDAIISLGNFDRGIGNLDQQAGTLLHELGHNLNLRHGGDVDKNCKPLYLSVMNYAYQFEDLVDGRPLTYASNLVGLVDPNNPTAPMSPLDEGWVDETLKVSDVDPPQKFTYGPIAPVPLPTTGQIGVDWNPNDPPGSAGSMPGLDNISDALGNNMCPNTTADRLAGYNDWTNIRFDSKGTSNYMDGRAVVGIPEESSACPPPSANDNQRSCSGGTGSNRADSTGYTRTQMILIKYESALSGLEQLRANQPMAGDSRYSTFLSDLRSELENENWRTARTILQDIRATYSSGDVHNVVNDAIKGPKLAMFAVGKEITEEEVRDMRGSRIGSLRFAIDQLPADNFKENDKQGALVYYHERFDFIANDLIRNGNPDTDMKKAIDELALVQKTYDGSSDVEDLITNIQAQKRLTVGTGEILKSYSNSMNDPEAAEIHGAGVTIELDQSTYTWTDKVHITIIAPDHNYDSNLIDEIGATDDDEIVISTNNQTITKYKLRETTIDSGIFVGSLTLTGFVYDADGNGMDDIVNPVKSPDGSGPNNGFLPAVESDLLTVSFEYAEDETVVATAQIRWSIADVSWLQPSYGSSGTGTLRVVDPDMNLDPDAIDVIHADVWSDSDAGGIDLILTETNEATGIFEGMVLFSTTDASSGNRLRVALGDTVTAEYDDNTLPAPYTITDQLLVTGTSSIN
jgi:hypothetical protein